MASYGRECQNCGHRQSTHLDDGTCLFASTKFKAMIPVVQRDCQLVYMRDDELEKCMGVYDVAMIDVNGEEVPYMKGDRIAIVTLHEKEIPWYVWLWQKIKQLFGR